MKKIFILMAILSIASLGGEIKDKFDKINTETDINSRIEMKLDLILEQYMYEEAVQEAREELLSSGIDKTKKGISNFGSWFKTKTNQVLNSDTENNKTKKQDLKPF